MSSSPAAEHPHRSGALAAAGVTAQIALAATVSLPVVKEVLGVVSRIVALSEGVERSREALKDLVEDARTTGQSITAVLSGRALEGELVHSLQALCSVLRSIEAFLEKQKTRTGLRKLLGHAFTTSKHVDSLTQDLSRASRRFLIVAAMDGHARLQEIDRSVGKINRQRDYEFDISVLTTRITYRRGQCSIMGLLSRAHEPRGVSTIRRLEREHTSKANKLYPRLNRDHGTAFEQFSRLLDKHPIIARLRAKRFTAMKSGYIPVSEIPIQDLTIEWTWDIIGQILDATSHLESNGVYWCPRDPSSSFLDDAGAPVIGLNNDLYPVTADGVSSWKRVLALGILAARTYGIFHTHGSKHTFSFDASIWDPLLTLGFCNTHRCSIPRPTPTLDEKTCRHLTNILTSCKDGFFLRCPIGFILLAASGLKAGLAFCTIYWAAANGRDRMYIHRAEESDEELRFMKTRVAVPIETKDELRRKLGITLPNPNHCIEIFISTSDPADLSSMSFKLVPR